MELSHVIRKQNTAKIERDRAMTDRKDIFTTACELEDLLGLAKGL